jgi:broad specificity phosphatase PhoE
MIQLILIRHGRTAWNTSEGHGPRFRGMIDLPLADDGKAQAEATARHLAGLPITAIYSSPLQRAARTAQTIAEPHGLEVVTVPWLGSMDYGDWAGRSYSQVSDLWPDLFASWRRDPYAVQIPGGGCMSELRDRALAAARQVLRHHKSGDTLVLVSHQAVTKTLVCGLMGLSNAAYWRVQQGLCNLTRFEFDPISQGITLLGLNDLCHLDPGLPHSTHEGVRILLIRHGQTAWNAGAGEERFRGRTDLPLDNTGHAQALALAARLRAERIDAIYCSPLLRTRQTGQALAGYPTGCRPTLQSQPDLLDIDYGRFQGLSHLEASGAYPELYSLWRTSPGCVHFPGGESLGDVQKRIQALFEELNTQHPGQTVALIGHQIVNKVVACTVLGLDMDQIWRIRQDTCGFDLFQRVGSDWDTLSLNDSCHLESMAGAPSME